MAKLGMIRQLSFPLGGLGYAVWPAEWRNIKRERGEETGDRRARTRTWDS